MSVLILAIPLVPIAVAALLFILGGFFAHREDHSARDLRSLAGWISVLGVLAATALAVIAFFEVRSGGEVAFARTWFEVGDLEVPLSLRMGGLQAVMAIVVTGVSLLVHLFSNGYMAGERNYLLYFAELSLFSGAMLLLVLADNFFLLYMGWELVGASSYLLISFYFERPAAAAAGKKAFLTTRLGDIGLLIGIFAIVWQTGSLEFETVFGVAEAGRLAEPWDLVIPLLIFAGAVGKSAQFPLHVWLPDAMEGPTPVSALIHAATMVAAGVYLVALTFPLFVAAPDSLTVVAWIGAVTALGAATIGVAQRDIKRVLAYSTISQLGFMMVALGVQAPEAGIFHLFTHAWFKALLFLGAGSVIHATGRQLVDEVGGLGRAMPITAWTFVIAALALAGIPPFAGFWSKEEILVSLADGHLALFIMLLLATFLTGFYIFRLVFLVFFGPPLEAAGAPAAAGGDGHGGRVHESGPVMAIPLLLLAIGALVAGFAGAPFLDSPLQGFLGFEEAAEHDTGVWVTILAVGAGLAGLVLAWVWYGHGERRATGDVVLQRSLGGFYGVLASGYRLDDAYERVLIKPGLGLARFLWRGIDDMVIDGAVNGLAWVTAGVGRVFRRVQSGIVRQYVALMAVGLIVVVAFLWRAL